MDVIADVVLGLALMTAMLGSAGLILGVASMAMAALGEALIERGGRGGIEVGARVVECPVASRGEKPDAAVQ